jgi:type I restriction enzyme S subunit
MELKKYKLGEILDVTRGASLSGEFYATEGKYIRLTCGNFDYQNNCFKENKSKDNIYYVGDFKPEFLMEKGDIITPLTEQAIGLLGSTAIIPESSKYIQSQDVAKIICKEDLLDKDFAFYLISSALVKQQLSAAAQQTKIRHTSPDKIKDCTVWIPELSEQKRIGKLLCSIDRKIELNRAINQNLEAMAKQLYDYWFVQFDFPNGEGKPYKSSGGKMVWNEKLKREIPQGWNNGMLIDIANITMGQSPDGSSYNEVGEGMLFYQGSTDFGMRFPSVRQYTTAPSRYAKRGDILMSVRAPVGSINIANNDCCIGRGLSAINSKLGSTTHLYYILNDLRIAFEQRNAAGTTFGSITKEDLYSLPIIIPSHEVIRAFDKICSPMFDRQMILGEEIDNLIKQRDGLLPLLMNGQVSVNSDLSKCISKIGIVALIRNYPNSLLKYWRLVIIYKCRITFSYNFSSHFASLPSPSQISSTSSDRLLPPRLVGDRPSGGRKWSLRHHWRRWRLEFRI